MARRAGQVFFVARLLILSAIYTTVIVGGIFSLCLFSFFRCAFGEEITITEALVPVAIILGVLLAVGFCVAYANAYVHDLVAVAGTKHPTLIRIAVGALSGLLPRLLWEVFTGTFPETFYPHIDYAPFLLGGVIVATLYPVFVGGNARVDPATNR